MFTDSFEFNFKFLQLKKNKIGFATENVPSFATMWNSTQKTARNFVSSRDGISINLLSIPQELSKSTHVVTSNSQLVFLFLFVLFQFPNYPPIWRLGVLQNPSTLIVTLHLPLFPVLITYRVIWLNSSIVRTIWHNQNEWFACTHMPVWFLYKLFFLPAKALYTTLFLISSDLKHTQDLVSDMHTII